jgi:ADP-heptose:LPS heptosyltransferase
MDNILLIRLKSIGDVVLTLPAVNVVRENFPAAKITFLTSRENAGLLRGFSAVQEVIALDRAALRSGHPGRMAAEFFGLLRRLRAGKFSLVVDFQGYGETAWLSWFTGAPQRWGTVYSTGRKWAYTRGVNRDDTLQIADFNLALLRQCGLPGGAIRNEWVLPGESLAEARAFFAAQKLDPARPTLFLQAFTSSPQKNWPLELFLELAGHFRGAGTQVIFACGPGEVAALEPARAAGHVVAAGLPLLTVAGVMKLSSVIIGGVTGLIHLAVAMQKRVVMLVGSPEIEPAFPYQHRDWAVEPAPGAGMAGIGLQPVVAACTRAFSEHGGSAAC